MSTTNTPVAAAAPAPAKESFGEKLEHVLGDIVEAPVKLITWGEKAEKVIQTAIADQPQLQSVLATLVKDAASIGTAAVTAGGTSGLNLTADASVLANAEAFFTYVHGTVIPLIETIYDQVKADITTE